MALSCPIVSVASEDQCSACPRTGPRASRVGDRSHSDGSCGTCDTGNRQWGIDPLRKVLARPKSERQCLERSGELLSQGSAAPPRCIELASYPCRPLRQKSDVAHRQQWHEKGRDQRKRQTLHQRSVVERSKKYRIEEICDAEQIPGKESYAVTISIVRGNARGNPRRGNRHGDVAKSRGPGKSAGQKSFHIAHQKSQANKSPTIQRDEKHRWDRGDHLAPGRNQHADQEEQERRRECGA